MSGKLPSDAERKRSLEFWIREGWLREHRRRVEKINAWCAGLALADGGIFVLLCRAGAVRGFTEAVWLALAALALLPALLLLVRKSEIEASRCRYRKEKQDDQKKLQQLVRDMAHPKVAMSVGAYLYGNGRSDEEVERYYRTGSV